MPFNIANATAGTQLLTGDNSANVNVGPGTATTHLSFNAHPVVGNNALAANTVTSAALTRFQGSITIGAGGTATISGPKFAGIGSVDGGGILYTFTLPSSFTIASTNTSSHTFSYAVL
ncbi:hypothetical protein [Tunturiibacter gelidiferens]|uniref:hypothetical protein n=1 Tax=Tunturiibacter gelidiferens TaxID=3069689 RepID=UPI003D9B7AC0